MSISAGLLTLDGFRAVAGDPRTPRQHAGQGPPTLLRTAAPPLPATAGHPARVTPGAPIPANEIGMQLSSRRTKRPTCRAGDSSLRLHRAPQPAGGRAGQRVAVLTDLAGPDALVEVARTGTAGRPGGALLDGVAGLGLAVAGREPEGQHHHQHSQPAHRPSAQDGAPDDAPADPVVVRRSSHRKRTSGCRVGFSVTLEAKSGSQAVKSCFLIIAKS